MRKSRRQLARVIREGSFYQELDKRRACWNVRHQASHRKRLLWRKCNHRAIIRRRAPCATNHFQLRRGKRLERDPSARLRAFLQRPIADDSAEWRDRIRSILKTQPGWHVIGEACDGFEAVQLTTKLCPDVVLLDIGMPFLNGIEVARRIPQGSSISRIIFVTQEHDADIRMAALATGAEAYLLKANATSELLPAVEAALRNVTEAKEPVPNLS